MQHAALCEYSAPYLQDSGYYLAAVQAATGPAGRAEPTCSDFSLPHAFVQPKLRVVGHLHGGIL